MIHYIGIEVDYEDCISRFVFFLKCRSSRLCSLMKLGPGYISKSVAWRTPLVLAWCHVIASACFQTWPVAKHVFILRHVSSVFRRIDVSQAFVHPPLLVAQGSFRLRRRPSSCFAFAPGVFCWPCWGPKLSVEPCSRVACLACLRCVRGLA